MGDIFTTRQKAERLIGKSGHISLSLLFPCPNCGHANRPVAQKLASVKLYLLDKLPPCRRCGYELKKRHFDRSTIPRPLMKRALAELGLEEAPASAAPDSGHSHSNARFIVEEDGGVRDKFKKSSKGR